MSVLLSAYSSVCMEQLGSHWTDFHEIWYFSIFIKYVENIQVSFKIGQEYWTLYMKTSLHFWSYLAHLFLKWEMFHAKSVEKIKTHNWFSVTFFRKSRRLWENMGKNVVERVRSQMTVWRTRIVCWIPKATDTHTEYVILIACPQQQWLHERATMLC
jgi:hypothetical protein